MEDKPKELLELIAKALVDNPDQVQVNAVEGEQVIVFELKVHLTDLGISVNVSPTYSQS